MKKFLKESQKEEPLSVEEEKGQMMGHTLKHGGLLRDILEGEVRKKGGRPRLNYFD